METATRSFYYYNDIKKSDNVIITLATWSSYCDVTSLHSYGSVGYIYSTFVVIMHLFNGILECI